MGGAPLSVLDDGISMWARESILRDGTCKIVCCDIHTIPRRRLRTTKNTARLSIFQTIEPCTDFTRCVRNRDKDEDRIKIDRKRRRAERDNGEARKIKRDTERDE